MRVRPIMQYLAVNVSTVLSLPLTHCPPTFRLWTQLVVMQLTELPEDLLIELLTSLDLHSVVRIRQVRGFSCVFTQTDDKLDRAANVSIMFH